MNSLHYLYLVSLLHEENPRFLVQHFVELFDVNAELCLALLRLLLMQVVFFVRMDQDPRWIDFFYEINSLEENHLNLDHHHHPNYLTRRRKKLRNLIKKIFTLSERFNPCCSIRRGLRCFDRPDWWPGNELEFPAPGFDVTELSGVYVRSTTLLFLFVDDCWKSNDANWFPPVGIGGVSGLGLVFCRWVRLEKKSQTIDLLLKYIYSFLPFSRCTPKPTHKFFKHNKNALFSFSYFLVVEYIRVSCIQYSFSYNIHISTCILFLVLLIIHVINNAERKYLTDSFFLTAYLKTTVPVENRLANIVCVCVCVFVLFNVRGF
jgi:hypothetical protein